MIKMRDFWMPFAPTILDSYAPKYIKNWDVVGGKMFESLKYMIVTVDATELAKEHLRAAIHQKDYTLRPQIVTEADNKDLYRLLSTYQGLTNMGGFMNTSFNLHGSPLVGTLDQAISTFENSGLRRLTLENFLISKRD
jgi:carbamoyltransferase